MMGGEKLPTTWCSGETFTLYSHALRCIGSGDDSVGHRQLFIAYAGVSEAEVYPQYEFWSQRRLSISTVSGLASVPASCAAPYPGPAMCRCTVIAQPVRFLY